VVYRWLTPPGIWVVSTGGDAYASATPPSNPVQNQLWFNAEQGALYIYYNDGNTTQWVPASPSVTAVTSPGGDFMATHSSTFTLPGAAALLNLNTIKTGNAGGWYSAGRYTPPAGRYFIRVHVYGGFTTAINVVAELRKNGVSYAQSQDTTGGASYNSDPAVDVIVDANGTDYFEMFAWAGSAGGVYQGYFLAFPLGGVKGPPGDPTLTFPVARFHRSSNAASGNTGGAWILAGVDTTLFNDGAGTFASQVWTPGAGTWRFEAALYLGAPGGAGQNQLGLAICKNNDSGSIGTSFLFCYPGQVMQPTISAVAKLNAGDTVSLKYNITGSDPGNYTIGGGGSTFLSGSRINS
jgi:hypothetical protein